MNQLNSVFNFTIHFVEKMSLSLMKEAFNNVHFRVNLSLTETRVWTFGKFLKKIEDFYVDFLSTFKI